MMCTTSSGKHHTLAIAAACYMCLSASAFGGSISNLVVTNLSGADTFEDNLATGIKRETRSSASLLSSNPTPTIPTLSARLAGMAAADRGGAP